MSVIWQPWIERAATRWPDALAYEDADGSVDFANLRESSRRLARVLRRLGVHPGERVATLLPASRLFVELFHAAQQARVALVPLNLRLQGPELARLLAHAAPKVVICEPPRVAELAQIAESSGVACEVTSTEMLLAAKMEATQDGGIIDGGASLDAPRGQACPEPSRGACPEPSRGACPEPSRGSASIAGSPQQWRRAAPSPHRTETTWPWDATGHLPEPMNAPQASDVLTLVYTSGTTAQPKGVLLSNTNYEAGALASCERLACRPGDRWLAVMPMCHVGGLAILARACLTGMTVVQQPRFDAASVERAMREEGVTFVSLVPTMLSLLLDQSDARPFPPSLRAIVLGGGRLPPALVERSAARGLPLVATFGMTETAAQVTTSYPGDAVLHPGSAGHPLPGVDLCIDNPDTSGLGEILVRGQQVFRAYDEAADLTARAIVDDWLHTGDLGRLDADGRLWVEVRRSDLIVSGGENVHPEEVEEVLKQHPAVADAGVFGIIDEHWGQRVAATVVLSAVNSTDTPTLQAWCRERLAGYKVPRDILFAPSLPRTESGKLQRQRLAGLAAIPVG